MKKLVVNILLISCIILFAFYIDILVCGISVNNAQSPVVYSVDYADYYAAGQLAIEGDSKDVYNYDIHKDRIDRVFGFEVDGLLAFPYPPTFLLLIAPLAFLPYYVSLTVWLLLSFGLSVFAIMKFVPKCKKLIMLMFGFPAVFLNIQFAQNGFLSTGLIGLGLSFTESNPILSGIMFGLLTYKPQMAFFPFALLLFLRKWRVLVWSCISAAAFIVVSGIAFGFDLWTIFVRTSIEDNVGNYLQWETRASGNPTLYSFFRYLGLSNLLSYVLLAISMILVIIAVRQLWCKTENPRLRAIAFVSSIPLATPYMIQYDLIILSIPLVLFAYECYTSKFHKLELAVFGLIFTVPVLTLLNTTIGVPMCPFIMITMLGWVYYRSRGQEYIITSAYTAIVE